MAQDETAQLIVSIEAKVDKLEKGMAKAAQTVDTGWKRIEKRTEQAGSKMALAVEGAVARIDRIMEYIASYEAVAEIKELADAYADLKNRISVVVGSAEKASVVMEKIATISRRTYTSVDDLSNGYLRYATILTSMGYSVNSQLRYQEALADALKLSGATASQASEVQDSLGAALSRSTIRTGQLARIMTVAPRVAQAMADGLGVPVAKLELLAQQGKLTSTVIVGSLLGSLTHLRREMAARPATLIDTLTVLKSALGDYIGRLATSQGVMNTFGSAVLFLADHFTALANGAAAAAAVMLAKYVPALARAVIAQAEVIATNPFLLMATAVAGASYAIAEFGDQIHPVAGDMANLQDYSAALWDDLKSGAQTAAQVVETNFQAVASAISEALGGGEVSFEEMAAFAAKTADIVIGAFRFMYDMAVTNWTKLPAAVDESTVNAMNGMIGLIEEGLNKVISLVNKTIQAINRVGGMELGPVGTVSIPRISNAFAGAGTALGKSYAGAFHDAASVSIENAFASLRAQADKHAEERQQADQREKAIEDGFGGPDNPTNPPSSRKGNAFEQAIRQQQDQLRKLQAETASRQSFAAQGADYEEIQAAVARAETAQNLLNKAQQAGLEINDQLISRIAQLADAYSKAAVEAKALAKSEQEAEQRGKELSTTGENAFKGFLHDIEAGKRSSLALSDALKKIADKFVDMATDVVWKSLMNGGGDGFFKSIGNVFAPPPDKIHYAPGSSLAGLKNAANQLHAASMTVQADVVHLSGASAPWAGTLPKSDTFNPGSSSIEQMIRQAAVARGMDPNVALKVWRSEGASGYYGDKNTSFGPFQLHYGGLTPQDRALNAPGLGDEFTRTTGLDARDPSTIQQQIDFALDRAKQNGWGSWYGARRAGISNWEGIDQSAQPQDASLDLNKVTASVSGLAGAATAAVPGLNQLGGALGGVISKVLGGSGGLFASIFHEGGEVGGAAPARFVSPSAFQGAPRFHSGLGSDEYAAILQRGERVLTANQHSRNMAVLRSVGAGGSTNNSVKIGDTNITVHAPPSSGNPQADQAQAKLIAAHINQVIDQKMAGWVKNQMRPGGVIAAQPSG